MNAQAVDALKTGNTAKSLKVFPEIQAARGQREGDGKYF